MAFGDGLRKYLAKVTGKLEGTVKIGFLEGATYPDGTPVAAVAAWNEYGAPEANIPSRPFIRNMIAAKSDDWADRTEKALKYYKYDGAKVLQLIGQTVAEEMQESIVNFKDPRNADSTIAKKGFDKPLIETGHMKDSVSFEVEK